MTMRILRKIVRRLRPDPVIRLEDCDVAYRWLNWVHNKIMDQGNHRLMPHYTWGVLQSAYMASIIGIPKISVLEFGVAGGNGLLALDQLPDPLREYLDIDIEVYGFDTGAGLPQPTDYRDLPNLWSEGGYPMNVDALKSRLTRANLILGTVDETVPKFLESQPAPIGFISVDVDYYSSTMDALKVLQASDRVLMPRVYCYFDDILGFTFGHHNGERLAITDFNRADEKRQISELYGLRFFVPRRYFNQPWPEMMYMAHIMDHELYCRPDGLVRQARLDLRNP